jgi:protein kinase C substrate 80K-H
MKCGVENIIHSVAELEKCEYQLTGTSPALCLPLENGNPREEL